MSKFHKMFKKNGKEDDSGMVGIGTLIVFISIVLTAAVAAIVLIQVSTILKQRGYETGKSSIEAVSTNVQVQYIVGVSTNSTNLNSSSFVLGAINETIIGIKLAPGGQPIDLRESVLSFETESGVRIPSISFNESLLENCSKMRKNNISDYCVEYIQCADETKDGVLEAGELVELRYWIEDEAGEYPLTKRGQEFTIRFTPKTGVPVETNMEVPPTIDRKYLTLYW